MNNKQRKVISMFLCLMVMFSVMVSPAFAEEADGSLEKTGFSGPELNDAESGKRIQAVGSTDKPTASIIDSGNCGESATWTLDSQGTLTISGSGKMNNYTFTSVPPWSHAENSIYKVVVKEGITHIGDYAFYYFSNLTQVSLPSSLTSIGSHAFAGGNMLSEITLPNKLKTIGVAAFEGVDYKHYLKEITIPSSVRTIGSSAFADNYALKNITIKNGVTSLGSNCFNNCEALESVVLPNSITSIGRMCFANTSSLQYVILPNNLSEIGEYTFMNSGIKCAVIPQSVVSIQSGAFTGCNNLEWVSIPTSVRGISNFAFNNCPRLKYVLYQGSAARWTKISIGSCNGFSSETTSGIRTNTYNPFVDVHPKEYYFSPVLWALNHSPQITTGISSYQFDPDTACTRGQAVTFLYRAAGSPSVNTANAPKFSDVKPEDYYYKAVIWAAQNGITTGYTGTDKFGPNDECTRAQIVTFMYRAAGSPSVSTSNAPKFSDVKKSDYFYKAVIWAAKKGITTGYTGTDKFGPNDKCTRGQVVTFLYRAK